MAARVQASNTAECLRFGVSQSNAKHGISLAGIDATDLDQRYDQVSKENLSRRVTGRFVVVVDWRKRDRYKRSVGKVLMGNQDQ